MSQPYNIDLEKEEIIEAVATIQSTFVLHEMQKRLQNVEPMDISDHIFLKLSEQINFKDPKFQGPLSPLLSCSVYFLNNEIFNYKITFSDDKSTIYLKTKFLPNQNTQTTIEYINYLSAEKEKNQLESSIQEGKDSSYKMKL
jgi:hypothetical protein